MRIESRGSGRSVVVVAAMICLGAPLAGCAVLRAMEGEQYEMLDSQLALPVRYSVEPHLEDDWQGTSITLHPDGKADVEAYPAGELAKDADGLSCVVSEGSPYTGLAMWVDDGRGHILITLGDRESILAADVDRVGDLNWAQTGIAFCDRGDVLWFAIDPVESAG